MSRIKAKRDHSMKAVLDVSTCVAHETQSAPSTIEEIIEEERARLMKAEAVLHCIAIAMDDADGNSTECVPDYQSAVRVACELVTHTIDRLDSLRVRPVLEKHATATQEGIREAAPKYLH